LRRFRALGRREFTLTLRMPKLMTDSKDCREIYHLETLVEPSAFSHQVLASGPFPLPENSNEPRAPREWEREIVLPGGQAHVGRHARQKAMEKLSRRAQQQEAEEPGDWFTTTQTRSDRDYHRERASGSSNVPTAPRKMVFGTLDAAARPFQFSAPSSSKALPLAQRLSYDRPHDSRSSRSRSGHERSSDSHTHNRHRDDHRERDQDRYTRRDERGPRYRGGYR
jgi:protein AIR1/2